MSAATPSAGEGVGAQVTGVCSTAKLDLVTALGADHVSTTPCEDFADGADRYDLILDIGGSASISRLRRALAPRGTAVFVGGEDGGNITGMGRQLRGVLLSVVLKQRLTLLVAKERASHFERLTELIEAGLVRPTVDRVFPLEEAQQAMRLLEQGRARGKVAITV